MSELAQIVKKLLEGSKGILAADASTPTLTKRFEKIGIESTGETRRRFRQLLVTTPNLERYIGGVILYDETIHQNTDDGINFAEYITNRAIISGIKVDQGTEPFGESEEEKVTKGLEGLGERLSEYKGLGAKFTKWRAVITIGEGIPTRECIEANADILAQYAHENQEKGLLPIIEPEVLIDGDHSIEKCEEVTKETLKVVFDSMTKYGVDVTGIILKPNMVLPGKDSGQIVSNEEIAKTTIRALRNSVPTEVPAVVFLSGGQSAISATERLNEICKGKNNLPWEISFSFERALEGPVMEIWKGRQENIFSAQKALLHRAKMNSLARKGEYKKELEDEQ